VLQLSGAELAVVTPAEPAQRGSQLSLRVRAGAQRGRRVFQSLGRRGLVCDWREPDIIRLAPVPFYNGFEDVLRAAWQLSESFREPL
jgi:kynureninase